MIVKKHWFQPFSEECSLLEGVGAECLESFGLVQSAGRADVYEGLRRRARWIPIFFALRRHNTILQIRPQSRETVCMISLLCG